MSFAPEHLTRDAFLDGRLVLQQPRRGYRAAIDPVFLAAFVPAAPGARVLELGCGAGAAILCLGRRVAGLELEGLDFQPDYAELARANAAANGIALRVHQGDLRTPPSELRGRGFDHVLMNPPFHPAAAGGSPDPGRDCAHREQETDLARWIDAGLRRLVPGGRLSLIHRAERLAEILAALSPRAGGVEILPLAPRAGRPAGRVLLRARKRSRAPLLLHPPLTVHAGCYHSGDGDDYTAAARAVLREMGDLLPSTRCGGKIA